MVEKNVEPMRRSEEVRRFTPLRVAMAIAALSVIALAVVLASQPSPGSVQAATPLLGKRAPVLSASYLLGPRVNAKTIQGKWLVVSFFSSWCVDCRVEAPQLAQFYNAHRLGKKVEVVMVSFDDRRNLAAQFLRLNYLPMPALFDTSGSTALDWGVREPPETFVVTPQGDVAARFVGPVQYAQLQSVVSGSRSP